MNKFKWHVRGLQKYYFRTVFKVAEWLFLDETCPQCGDKLHYNATGKGKCTELYCESCICEGIANGTLTSYKHTWSFEELAELPGTVAYKDNTIKKAKAESICRNSRKCRGLK